MCSWGRGGTRPRSTCGRSGASLLVRVPSPVLRPQPPSTADPRPACSMPGHAEIATGRPLFPGANVVDQLTRIFRYPPEPGRGRGRREGQGRGEGRGRGRRDPRAGLYVQGLFNRCDDAWPSAQSAERRPRRRGRACPICPTMRSVWTPRSRSSALRPLTNPAPFFFLFLLKQSLARQLPKFEPANLAVLVPKLDEAACDLLAVRLSYLCRPSIALPPHRLSPHPRPIPHPRPHLALARTLARPPPATATAAVPAGEAHRRGPGAAAPVLCRHPHHQRPAERVNAVGQLAPPSVCLCCLCLHTMYKARKLLGCGSRGAQRLPPVRPIFGTDDVRRRLQQAQELSTVYVCTHQSRPCQSRRAEGMVRRAAHGPHRPLAGARPGRGSLRAFPAGTATARPPRTGPGRRRSPAAAAQTSADSRACRSPTAITERMGRSGGHAHGVPCVGRDGAGRDGAGRDGAGRDGAGMDGAGRGGAGKDGTGRDGAGRDGDRTRANSSRPLRCWAPRQPC